MMSLLESVPVSLFICAFWSSRLFQVSFTYTDTQMDVANLLLNIEKFSFDNLVSTVTYLIKDCVGKSGKQSGPAVEKVQVYLNNLVDIF